VSERTDLQPMPEWFRASVENWRTHYKPKESK
jgi:hypothetical protein